MADDRDPDPSELQALLRRAAGGDSDAWRRIVAEYAPRVFGLLRSRCGDDELAEEITQSTMCTLASKLGDYVETGRFESWIFRIAVNRLRDEIRRKVRHARPTDAEAMAAIGQSDRRPRAMESGEIHDRLGRAMARLSEGDREIIDLRHTGGMSFKALSDFYGEPLGTLLARHHRALKKLRALLEGMGVTAEDLGDAEGGGLGGS